MSVEMALPQNGVEACVLAFDQAGKQVPVPHKIVIDPYFFRPDSIANIVFLSVSATEAAGVESPTSGEDSEEQAVIVQRVILQLPGSTGKLRVADRSAKVMPKFAKVFFASEAVVGGEPLTDEDDLEDDDDKGFEE